MHELKTRAWNFEPLRNYSEGLPSIQETTLILYLLHSMGQSIYYHFTSPVFVVRQVFMSSSIILSVIIFRVTNTTPPNYCLCVLRHITKYWSQFHLLFSYDITWDAPVIDAILALIVLIPCLDLTEMLTLVCNTIIFWTWGFDLCTI
jgi:hypothetical protein